MRNAILFLVVLLGILQPERSTANGVLEDKTTKSIHYEFEKTLSHLPTLDEGLVITFSTVAVSCPNSQDGEITAHVTSGISPFTYKWNNDATTATIKDLAGGNYRVTVSDANGRSAVKSTKLYEPDPLVLRADVKHVSCGKDSDGKVEVYAEGGTSPYTYTWEIGGTGATREHLPPGKYSITVTDAKGCITEIHPTLLASQSPKITSSVTATSCSGNGKNGKVSIEIEGDSAPFDIKWSTGDTQRELLSGLAPGDYSVTVTNTGGCSSIATMTVSDANVDFQVTVEADEFICGHEPTGTAKIIATGGVQPYRYQWSHGPTDAYLFNLTASDYTVTISDFAGCTKEVGFSIREEAVPELTIPTPGKVCFGSASQQIIPSVTGGVTPYSYLWNTGATTEQLNNVTEGTYTVTVTGANGCSVVGETKVRSLPEVFYDKDITPVTCPGGSDGQITTTIAGGTDNGFTYLWSDGHTGASLNNISAGTYTVTITDRASKCEIIDEITVPEPDPIIIQTNSIPASSEDIADGTASLTVSGGTPGYTYVWSNGETGTSIEGVPFGIYTVTVTDAAGCTKTATIEIEALCVLEVQLFPTPITCNGNDGALVAEASQTNHQVTYNWSTGAIGRSITGLESDTYSVTATDAVGCTAIDQITLRDNQIFLGDSSNDGGSNGDDSSNSGNDAGDNNSDNDPTDGNTNNSTITIQPVSCHGGANGQITVAATGGTGNGFTYTWSNGQTGNTASNLSAGTYTVSVTDAATGCTITRNITISEPDPIIITPTIVNASDEMTADGSISVEVTGGTAPYTYMWSNGATTATVENLPFGSYTVKVTDANGCMETITVVIDPNCTIEVKLFPTAITCKGNDGSLVAVASRTDEAVSYAWSNGQTGRSIIGLSPGTYSVTATDAAGCSIAASIFLEDNQIFLGGLTMNGDGTNDNTGNTGNEDANNGSNGDDSGSNSNGEGTILITPVSCHGGSDGQITVEAAGGTGNGFTYTWSNGQSGNTATNLSAGTYTISVTDAATGCTITRNITISEPAAIIIQPTIVNASDENTADGSASVEVTGGTPPYTYMWSTGATTSSVDNLPFGSYTVKVTDANGCMETITVVIDPNCTIGVQLFPTSISCRGNDGSIVAEVAGNKGAVTYAWNNGQTGRSITGLAPGTYSVIATDAAGCTATSSFTLEDNQIILDDNAITNSAVSCHGSGNGRVTVAASGGTGSGFGYAWSNGQTGPTATNLVAGIYTVTVTDLATTCSITKDITVTEPNPITVQSNITNATTETSGDGSITISVAGGTPPYSYSWSTGATTATINNLTIGTYQVTITDGNGCQKVESIVVAANCVLEGSIAATPVSCEGNDGALTFNVTNATGAITYRWSNGMTGATISGLSLGFYSVTATDALGCTISGGASVDDACICIEPEINTIVVMEATGIEETDGYIELTMKAGNERYNYQWSHGASTSLADELSPGLYSVTITDKNEPLCSLETNVMVGNSTIKIGPVEVTAITGSECGQNNGSAELFPTGLNYQWSDGGTGSSRVNLAPGTYMVTATFDQLPGEQDIVEVVIETIGGLDASATINQQPECGNNNGSATINATKGSGNYTYSWGPSNTRTDLTSGTYSVTITDRLYGCEDIVTFVIKDNAPGVSIETISINPVTCKGEANGSAQFNILTTNEVVQPVTQRITDGLGNTYSPSTLAAGQYCLEVLDGNNCLVGGTCFEITQPDLLYVEISRIPATCSTNGIIIVKADGANGDYNFNWTDVPGSDNTPGRSDLAPGIYAISVNDGKGCGTFIDNIRIAEPKMPTVNLEPTQPATLTSNDGSISVVTEGGLPPFRYFWSTGEEGTPTIENLGPGDYAVTVVDDNGCVEELEIPLIARCDIAINSSVINTSCAGGDGSISLNITGGTGTINYQWSNGSTTASINNLSPGPYRVTITDQGECDETANFFIGDGCNCTDPVIESIVTVKETVPDSKDGTITIQVKANNPQFTWSDPSLSGNRLTGLAAGVYKVTITDGDCSTTKTIPVGNGNIPSIEVVSISNTPCGESIGSATLGPDNLTYEWSDGGTGTIRNDLAAGEYIITATDPTQPGVSIIVITIETEGGLNARPIIGRLPDCGESNGQVSIEATGGSGSYTYSWGTSNSQNSLASGTYSITVFDQVLDCKEVVLFTLLDNVPSVEVVFNTTRVTCVGDTDGSVQINLIPSAGAAGPFTQTIKDGAGNEFDNSNLPAGDYCVEVRDRNGCLAGGDCFVIMEPDLLAVTVSPTLSSCNDDGTLTVEISGGNGGAMVNWSDGTTGVFRENLGEGTYGFEVVDMKGCSAAGEAAITKIRDPQVAITSMDATNIISNDGTATANPSAGTSPYTYVWNNGETTPTISGLSPGTYEVTLTDANGCTSVSSTEIIASCTDPVSVNISPLAVCKGTTGILSFNIAPSPCFEGPLDSRVTDSQGTEFDSEQLPAGSFILEVLDANGNIIASENFTIETVTDIVLDSTVDPATCDDKGAIRLAIEGGNANYTFDWEDIPGPSNGANRSALDADNYTVTITNNLTGCTIEEGFPVPNEGLELTTEEEVFTCDGMPVQLSVVNNKPSDNLTYTWSPASGISAGATTGTPTVQVDSIQEFTYTVENQFGCQQSGSVLVTNANTQPPGEITQSLQCNGLVVDFKSTGGASDYYIWDFGDGNTSEEANPTHVYDAAGNYTVTLKLDPRFPCADDLGILSSRMLDVMDGAITKASFTPDFEPCEDEGLVQFNNTSEVSPGPVSYMWNFGNGMTSTEENPLLQLEENVDLNISLTIKTPTGCEDVVRDNLDVIFFKQPTVFDSIQTCAGIPTELNPNPSEGEFKYSWTPAQFLDNATIANPTAIVDKTTRIDVTIGDGICEAATSVLLLVPAEADIELPEDEAICSDENQVFFAEVAEEGAIIWSSMPDFSDTISTEPEFMASPGIYYFSFTDTFGCNYTDELAIENALIDAEMMSDVGLTICRNTPATLTIRNNKPIFEYTAYEWLEADGILNTDFQSPSLVVRPTTTTEYCVVLTNEAGCIDTICQVFEVPDIDMEVMVTADPDTIFANQTSELEVTPAGETVIWMDDPSAGPTRTVSPIQTTNYMVTVRDENNCEGTGMVTVVVEMPVCGPPNIFFPNAFTPNGDGINDVLRVRGNGMMEVFWRVVNRWGQIVFEANSEDDVWDGTFDGKLVDPDVYGFELRVVCFSGEIYETQGNVTVLR